MANDRLSSLLATAIRTSFFDLPFAIIRWYISLYDYFKKHDLTPEYQINDLEPIVNYVKYVLETHYQYKEEIPNLKIKISEILAEEIL